jgi:hypothetical protein
MVHPHVILFFSPADLRLLAAEAKKAIEDTEYGERIPDVKLPGGVVLRPVQSDTLKYDDGFLRPIRSIDE